MTTYNISATQAYEWLLNGEAVLIDVREPEEFKADHIPYAMSVPLGQVGHVFPELKIPQDRKVIFQCFRGRRGEQACVLTGNITSTHHVYNITGGIDEWKASGLPIIADKAGQRISIFRQVQMIVGALIVVLVLLGFTVNALAFAVAGILAAALAFAGATGWCGLAKLLAFAPWNRK